MSESPPPSETQPKKAKRWQFSLRKLLLLVTAVALFCGIASWTLTIAFVLAGLTTLLGTLVALIIRKLTLIESLVILSVVGVILAMVLPVVRIGRPIGSTGILAVRVIDVQTNQPVVNSTITLFPNGFKNRSVPGTTNQQGECRIAATFSATTREVGWGRQEYLLQLKGTQLTVSAPGYEPTTVHWEDVSDELVRPAEAPPEPVVEIRLQPKTLP